MKTNCIVERHFLFFWKYRTVEHNYQIYEITKFMNSSTTFHVTFICEKCGVKYVNQFVDVDTLILKDIPVDVLNAIAPNHPYYPNKAF